MHTFSTVCIGDLGVVSWYLVQSDWQGPVCNDHVATYMSHTYLPYTCNMSRVGVWDPPGIIAHTATAPSPGIQCPSLKPRIPRWGVVFNHRPNQSAVQLSNYCGRSISEIASYHSFLQILWMCQLCFKFWEIVIPMSTWLSSCFRYWPSIEYG